MYVCVRRAAPRPPTAQLYFPLISHPLARFLSSPFVQAQGGGDMKSPSMSPAQPRGPGAPGQGAAAGRNDPAGAREEVSHHVDLFVYICSIQNGTYDTRVDCFLGHVSVVVSGMVDCLTT